MKTLLAFMVLTTSLASFGQQHHFYHHYFNNKHIFFKSIINEDNVLNNFPDHIEELQSSTNKSFSMNDYSFFTTGDYDYEKQRISAKKKKGIHLETLYDNNYYVVDDIVFSTDKVNYLNRQFSSPNIVIPSMFDLHLNGGYGLVSPD